jgi:hypothetical protein
MKRYTTLIALGIINVLHGCMHIFQVIQSFFLASYSISGQKETWIHKFLENPYVGAFWAIIGIATIVIGVRDYRHHLKHKD